MKYWRIPTTGDGWDYARASAIEAAPFAEYFDIDLLTWVRDDRYWADLHFQGDWSPIPEAAALAAVNKLVPAAS